SSAPRIVGPLRADPLSSGRPKCRNASPLAPLRPASGMTRRGTARTYTKEDSLSTSVVAFEMLLRLLIVSCLLGAVLGASYWGYRVRNSERYKLATSQVAMACAAPHRAGVDATSGLPRCRRVSSIHGVDR